MRQNRCFPSTDLDFADDLALLSDEITPARAMLQQVETECTRVGLLLNAKKTKYMTFNIEGVVEIKTLDGKCLERAVTQSGDQDFRYLGAWIASTSRDMAVRKALAWKSLHKLKAVWSSQMKRKTKIDLFRATTKSVLLYGAGTWTMNRREEKSIDGCYTRMLRMVLNVSWKSHTTNKVLYGKLPKLSDTIRMRRLRLAGHSHRDHDSPIGKLVTWIPAHGTTSVGRPTRSYVDVLLDDAGVDNVAELETYMADRNLWRNLSSRGINYFDR